MVSNLRIKIEKFNGKKFELWKIKIEDLFVYREQWKIVCLGTMPTGMSTKEWEKLERRERIMIQNYLLDSVQLSALGEYLTNNLWDMLGSLYQSKFMVDNLFIINKPYFLRMSDKISVTEYLNGFNTIIIQLSSMNIKITEEVKFISLLCSFLDLWDNLVMYIGINTTTLSLEEVVASILL
jgi:hypothetical protein